MDFWFRARPVATVEERKAVAACDEDSEDMPEIVSWWLRRATSARWNSAMA